MTWINSFLFTIVRWGILLIEIYFAKQVYQAIQQKTRLRNQLAQIRLLAAAHPSQRATRLNPSFFQASAASPIVTSQITSWLMLQEGITRSSRRIWNQLAMVTFIVGVFATAFLMVSFILRPITNLLAITLIPLCIPLIALPLPYLLCMEPPSTLLLLVTGLGLSFLLLAMIGV